MERMDDLGGLRIRYTGEAFDDNAISARELSPALMDLADAIGAAGRAIAPGAKTELKVTATERGSFAISFILKQIGEFSATQQGQGILFLSSIGIGSIIVEAIRETLRRLKHNGKGRETKSNPLPGDGLMFSDEDVEIEYPDGAHAHVRRSTLAVADCDEFVRKAGSAFSRPGKDSGEFDGVEIKSSRDPKEKVDVSASEAEAMSEWDPAAQRSEGVETKIVQAIDLSFRSGGKWKVTDGQETEWVSIEDKTFLKRIDAGDESFRKNDMFKVRMRIEKTIDAHNRLKAKWIAVVEVIEHRSIASQPKLF